MRSRCLSYSSGKKAEGSQCLGVPKKPTLKPGLGELGQDVCHTPKCVPAKLFVDSEEVEMRRTPVKEVIGMLGVPHKGRHILVRQGGAGILLTVGAVRRPGFLPGSHGRPSFW